MNPSIYILYNAMQKENIKYITDEFDEQLKNISGKCMDIGCGPGDTTKNILLPALNLQAEMIGTDVSKSIIEYANETYADEERLKFEILDIETKNLPEKYISKFDYVFSFNALHWIQDARQTFENMYRMLRPGGNMLILFPNTQDLFEAFKITEQDIRFIPYIRGKQFISPFYDSVNPRKELKQLLQSIGFNVWHCSLREKSFVVKNPDEFSLGVVSLFSFLREMPHKLRQEYKDKFMHEYAKRKIIYQECEETVALDLHKILVVFAQKNMS